MLIFVFVIEFLLVAFIAAILFVTLVILPLMYLCIKSMINKIPGVPENLVFGNSNKFLREKRGYLSGIEECVLPFKNKSICRFWIGINPYVVFNDSDHLSLVYNTLLAKKTALESKFTKPWFGEGILLGDSKQCFFRKKLLASTFHSPCNLQSFFVIMNKECAQMIGQIRNKLLDNNSIELMHCIDECTLNTICETALGINTQLLKRQKEEYLKALAEFSAATNKRVRSLGKSPWLYYDFAYRFTSDGKKFEESVKALNKFTRSIIDERFKVFYFKFFTTFLDAYLEAYLEDGSHRLGYASPEVAATLFEGHDKIATTLMWACYCVARNPDVQEKLQIELKQLLGDDSNRELTLNDLNELEYLECVLKEVLRLFPTVPILYRQFVRDATIDGYEVPAGTTALVYIYQINRDERYFPEPEKFIPERFLPQNFANLPAYAYITFNSGRRSCCMGQEFAMIEIKLFMANLIRNFDMTCDQTVDVIMPEMKLLLKPENPIIFNLKTRIDQTGLDQTGLDQS